MLLHTPPRSLLKTVSTDVSRTRSSLRSLNDTLAVQACGLMLTIPYYPHLARNVPD